MLNKNTMRKFKEVFFVIFVIFLLINIDRACVISIFDEDRDLCICGNMQIIGDHVLNGKFHNIIFLDKNLIGLDSVFGCRHICNTSKHDALHAFLRRKQNYKDDEYQLCVFNSSNKHIFDVVLVRDLNDRMYKMYFFKHKYCIFKIPKSLFLVNDDFCYCCSCEGSSFIKMILYYEIF